MKLSTFSVALSALTSTFAAAQTAHKSGGKEHVVIFNKDHPIPPAVEEVLQRLELNSSHPDVKRVFDNSAFRGFAAEMLPHCLDLLANMTDVSTVEETVEVSSMRALPNQRRQGPFRYDTRGDAPWGLQRISTSSSVKGDPNVMDFTYTYANSDLGKGADIYVIDTGLYDQHVVFGDRAKQIWSYDGKDVITDGHGTHVAGTAAGETLGVASKANIFGVQALTGEGTGFSSNVVAGIDFVVRQHDQRKAQASSNGHRGSVLSMSLASQGTVGAIDSALDAAVRSGVHAVVAAGNSNKDACSGSPSSSGGSHGPVITVGSVGISGKRSSFSNYGECVDVYAPGEDIVSAWIGAPNMVDVLSGTSMATPHVTGIVAYAMANQTLADNPGLMKEWITMQGLPRSDGTVLANNGVTTSSPNTISNAAIQSAQGWQKSKRGVEEAFDDVATWFKNAFSKTPTRRSSSILVLDANVEKRGWSNDKIDRWFDNTLTKIFKLFHLKPKNREPRDIEARGSGEGFKSHVNWLTNLFHGRKKHHRRADVLERGIGKEIKAFFNLLGKLVGARNSPAVQRLRSAVLGKVSTLWSAG